MKALAEVFPPIFNQLCRWHIQQNILKHCCRNFNSMPQFENFMAAVKKLAISDTEKDTQKTLQQIEIDFPSQAVDYFKTQWWYGRERWVELHV
ncbi:hypothetical protein POJ06DRAFT_209529, partial [Lipomyces tetrasporus]